MISKKHLLICFIFLFLINCGAKTNAFHSDEKKPNNTTPQTLKNPISIQYLQQHLLHSNPRLILNSKIEQNLKQKIKTDPVVKNLYKAIRLNAAKILKKPLLKRKLKGKRLLDVSKEMLYRINILGILYRIEKNDAILNRINEEIIAVCHFLDWNPSHFLDTAEMSLAVALAIDWTAGALPEATIKLAKSSLIEKGIKPSFIQDNNSWLESNTNWNPVCNAGMIAAAIAIAEENPKLATTTIRRALNKLPIALKAYAPSGTYPEGPMYWMYGTGYTVLIASMLESAFGTDFGLSKYPGFMESALFWKKSIAPSGKFYNFADSSDKRKKNGNVILAWFASKTGNKLFYEKERFLTSPEKMSKLYRNSGAGLTWIAQYKENKQKKSVSSSSAWKGDGANPIVIFSNNNDAHQYYFGGKGGGASVNHGNMDAGSFIFELNGVRWVIDSGIQPYLELEKAGVDLWCSSQDCERWTLLTKNNFGHSTLTINNKQHIVQGNAQIIDFKKGKNPEATIDMTPIFKGALKSATRKFKKDSPTSLKIEDEIIVTKKTELITWQLMTTSEVEITKYGAILKQDNKRLYLENISHPEFPVSVVSLDPPPLKLDRYIENLKRIEIKIPTARVKGNTTNIKVKLSDERPRLNI